METLGVIIGIVALVLVTLWNYIQAKRIDGLQMRIDALEKR